MRIGLWPFFSQQDKRRNLFRLDTCGATKQAMFIAKKLAEIGSDSRLAVPPPMDCVSMVDHPHQVHIPVPLNNGHQIVNWSTVDIERVFYGCDAAIVWHEYLALPIRKVYPKLPILQIIAVDPHKCDPDLLYGAWKAATRVVTQTAVAANFVRTIVKTPPTVWRMCYDERNILPSLHPSERPIDVLLVTRCSSTNYTHHEEFVAQDWTGLNVVYTDVTEYLRSRRPDLQYSEPNEYYRTLQNTKVAVALNDDMFGGQAIREAIMAGCTPVVYGCPCYTELVGDRWPYKTYLTDLRGVCDAAVQATNDGSVDNGVPYANAKCESYEEAWKAIRTTLQAVTI